MKKKKIAALTGIASLMAAGWFTVTTTSSVTAIPAIPLAHATTSKTTTTTTTKADPFDQFFDNLRAKIDADRAKEGHHW